MKRLNISPDLTVYQFTQPVNDANMYVILQEDEGLIIDTFRTEELKRLLDENGIRRLTILLTHEHWDHTGGVPWLQSLYECSVCAGENAAENLKNEEQNMSRHYRALLLLRKGTDRAAVDAMDIRPVSIVPDVLLKDGERLVWKKHELTIRFTPGHTEGSISILADGCCIFTGDSLVNGHPTITRFYSGSPVRLEQITRPILESFPGDLMVCPGHGEADRLDKLLPFLDSDGRLTNGGI